LHYFNSFSQLHEEVCVLDISISTSTKLTKVPEIGSTGQAVELPEEALFFCDFMPRYFVILHEVTIQKIRHPVSST